MLEILFVALLTGGFVGVAADDGDGGGAFLVGMAFGGLVGILYLFCRSASTLLFGWPQ